MLARGRGQWLNAPAVAWGLRAVANPGLLRPHERLAKLEDLDAARLHAHGCGSSGALSPFARFVLVVNCGAVLIPCKSWYETTRICGVDVDATNSSRIVAS